LAAPQRSPEEIIDWLQAAIVVSLSWRAPMREPEPEKVPFGLPLRT
jgi:hypothetical protein